MRYKVIMIVAFIYILALIVCFLACLCNEFFSFIDEDEFWVCREINGKNYAVTEIHVKNSECLQVLVRSVFQKWHCSSEVGTLDVIVKFENTSVGQEAKLSEYVYKTSASSPFVLVYGKNEM